MANLKDYMDFLKDKSEPTSQIRIGRFYSYHYMFSRDIPHEKLKFYDVAPLVFCFNARSINGQRIIECLNFHHLPILARNLWLNRLKKIAGTAVDQDKILSGLDYTRLHQMFKKSSYAVRQYRRSRIRSLRRVSTENLEELINFSSNTHLSVNLAQIENKYRQFIPKNVVK